MKQGERNIVEIMISQFCRDQLNCLSTNQPKDDRTFRAITSIISCVRENILHNICCQWTMTDIFDFASLQDRQEKFCQRAIYGMIDGSQNTIFS